MSRADRSASRSSESLGSAAISSVVFASQAGPKRAAIAARTESDQAIIPEAGWPDSGRDGFARVARLLRHVHPMATRPIAKIGIIQATSRDQGIRGSGQGS